ncbi:MAG: adenylosuccinate synthetase [Bacteroidales bacterium]|nr:adenylosuccinate synthetase [Bacteroidales bacterium]
MKVSVVLGMTFGDEGKGATTQWLCQQSLKYGRNPLVVRFNGGAQAAHTVCLNGKEHICSTYGSGVLLGVPTFLSKDFFFDPLSAYQEHQTLKELNPTLMVHSNCRIVTPYDVLAGVNNAKVLHDGSCGKGIFQTFDRYNRQSFDNILLHFKQEDHLRMLLYQVRSYYQVEQDDQLEELFIRSMLDLPLTVTELPTEGHEELIYEGAQGLLLDMDYGFFPNVTPSHTGLDNIPPDQLRGANVYLVTRTYTTRHGNGFEPKHKLLWDLNGKLETNVDNEFQGPFKVGMLELGLLHRAIDRHHLDVWQKKYDLKYHLMVTHGDLALKHGYFDYLFSDGLWGKVEINDLHDIKRVFIHEMNKTQLRFQSIRVNSSVEGNFE